MVAFPRPERTNLSLSHHEQVEVVSQQPLLYFHHHDQVEEVQVQPFLLLLGQNGLGGEKAVVVLVLLAYDVQGKGDAVLERQYRLQFVYTVIQTVVLV